MFCRNCGKEVNDNAVVCIHCGCSLDTKKEKQLSGESKTGLGVVLGIFLGLIGLIIGLCMYPAETIERKSFIKGWGIAFGVSLAIVLILYFAVFATMCSAFYYY